MLATQRAIDGLADRIERAYRRRRPDWRRGCSTARVWSFAAESLLQARETNPSLPIDPELYVLAQPCDSPYADPWADLTGPSAVEHYSACLHSIIASLRDELNNEIRRVEEQIERGRSVAKILLARNRKLSPLGRYLVALRAGRPALAIRFLGGAQAQHRACPLYREAASAFLPPDLYPAPAFETGEPTGGLTRQTAGRRDGPFPSN